MGAVVLSNFITGIAVVLGMLLNVYFWIVVIAAVLTWVNPDPRNPIVRFLYGVTEPVFHEVRRRLPFVYGGGFDFSPLVVIALIYFLDIAVVRSLAQLAESIRSSTSVGLHVG